MGLLGVVALNVRRSTGRARATKGWYCLTRATLAAASCIDVVPRWLVLDDDVLPREVKRDRRYRNTSLMSKSCSHSSLVNELFAGFISWAWPSVDLPGMLIGFVVCRTVGWNSGTDRCVPSAALLAWVGASVASGITGSPAYGSDVCCTLEYVEKAPGWCDSWLTSLPSSLETVSRMRSCHDWSCADDGGDCS